MKSPLLVISTFPEKGQIHSQKTVGGASYTKTLLTEISRTSQFDITVWAEYFEKPQEYNEDGLHVSQSWKRGSWMSILKLAKNFIFSKFPTVALSFEGYMFGSAFLSLPIFVSLLVAKATGKKTVIILHQVVSDFSHLEKNPVRKLLYTIGRSAFYNLILSASSNVVVFENTFKKHLNNSKKVSFVPLAIFDKHHEVSRAAARNELKLSENETAVLYFGYIAPYKGVDWLVDQWPSLKNTKLILAGDINPNHSENCTMKQFVDGVKTVAKKKSIQVPGFIPEDKIATYFRAADVLILPYQTMMSSSGPLSLAIAYQLPVLFSKPLSGYFESPDMKNALANSKLEEKDILFELTKDDLVNKLSLFEKNKPAYVKFIQYLEGSRQLSAVARQFAEIFI